MQISFHWKSCVWHSAAWNSFRSQIVHQTVWKNLKVDQSLTLPLAIFFKAISSIRPSKKNLNCSTSKYWYGWNTIESDVDPQQTTSLQQTWCTSKCASKYYFLHFHSFNWKKICQIEGKLTWENYSFRHHGWFPLYNKQYPPYMIFIDGDLQTPSTGI